MPKLIIEYVIDGSGFENLNQNKHHDKMRYQTMSRQNEEQNNVALIR